MIRRLLVVLIEFLIFFPAEAINKDTTWKPVAIMYQNEYGQYAGKWIKGADVQIPTNPEAPVALVGDDKTIPYNQSSIILDGSSSYSPGGDNLTYYWSLETGNSVSIINPNAATTTVTGLFSGDYTFKLTVTDQHSRTNDKELHIHVEALPSYVYYVVDSALFNFTPVAQNVPGWTDVVGEPTTSVVTATSSNGITVSTIGTDSIYWRGDPTNDNKSGSTSGMDIETAEDPFGFVYPKKVTSTGFVNAFSGYVPGTNNLKISGLDPESRYQVRLLGSWGVGSGNATDNLAHDMYTVLGNDTSILNTVYNTSRESVFDTVAPDSNGDIFLSITGVDSTYAGDNGTATIVSGMKIYKISKEQYTGAFTYKHEWYYDRVMTVDDGKQERPLLVYKPYNYNPSKSYPIVASFGGGGSRTVDNKWNAQFITNFGLSRLIEHDKGKFYGIDKNGDTCSYIVIQPAQSLFLDENGNIESEPYFTSKQVDSIISYFKAHTELNYNDSLYVGGFSSGGAQALSFAWDYPEKVTGAFIQSAGEGVRSYPNFVDGLSRFATNEVHFFVVNRNDNISLLTREIAENLPEELVYSSYWYRDHTGFVADYLENFKYGQNIFDWIANPSNYDPRWRGFLFVDSDFNLGDGFTTDSTFDYQTPAGNIVMTKKSPQGWWIQTISTGGWESGGGDNGSNLYETGGVYNYPKFGTVNELYTKTSILRNNKEYVDEPNIVVKGLKPNHSYSIQVVGKDYYDSDPQRIAIFQWGAQKDTINTSLFIHKNPATMTGTSDSSGEIKLGWYKAPSSGGNVRLQYLLIREN